MNYLHLDEEAIFHATRRLSSVEARRDYLAQACGNDQVLRSRVEHLLRVHEEENGFLEPPLNVHPTIDLPVEVAERLGTRIGPYKLLQKIGEGGFGVVYMAEQTDPVQRMVALKIIKPGMDTKEVIARFEAERQALALMEHPNVARVLDAGATESGRPYFVMELVHGICVTEFCDKRELPVHQRLQLFVDVCQAVQHAHQKGVIHRDLKPTNVLVTLHGDTPVPKIIDFGVAKALSRQLTEKTLFTAFGQMVGTPLYMSPEQAEMSGLDVDTRSDVYSLGVLLYELLTGTTPFDKQALQKVGFDEMRRIIRQDDPPKPSDRITTIEANELSTLSEQRQTDSRRLTRSLRGELDWIVMKALEKDRNRRYESASAFGADIERYLNDEMVEARSPSAAYRLRKLARRNKGKLTVAALSIILLIVTAVGASIAAAKFHALAGDNAELASDLKKALQDAESNLQIARRQQWIAQENLTRANAERRRAKQNLVLATDEQRRAEQNFDLAMRSLNRVYLQAIGRQRLLREHDPTREKQELTDQEKQLLKIGLDFYVEIASQNETSPTATYQVASAFLQLGVIQANLEDHAAAEEALSNSIRRLKQLSEDYPDNPHYFGQLGRAFYTQARIGRWWPDENNSLAEAERALSNAIALDPKDAKSYSTRARVRRILAKGSDAAADLRKAVSLDPGNPHHHIELADILAYSQTPGVRNHRLALEHANRAVELDPQNAFYHATVGRITNLSGGDKRTALEHIAKAIELDRQFAWAYIQRAKIKRDLKLYQQALVDAQKGVELRPDWEYAVRWRGNIYMECGRYEEALVDFDRAESLNPNGIWVYLDRGVAYTKLGKFQKALEDYNKAVELYPASQDAHRLRVAACFQLGKYDSILADIGKFLKLKHTAALSWIPVRQVAQCSDQSFQQGMLELADEAVRQRDTAQMRSRRGKLLMALGRQEQAIIDFQKAAEMQPDNPGLLNNMAWCVVRSNGSSRECIDCALEMAEKAAELTPQKDVIWNTLGVARYRAGKYPQAIKALTTSEEVGKSRNLGFNGFFLAMAHRQLEHTDEASRWYDRAAEWMKENAPMDEELIQFRTEAEKLLQVNGREPTDADQQAEGLE